MKSFKAFLSEEWNEYRGGGMHRVSHSAQIGPHKVSMYFQGKEGTGRYNIDFTVDNHLSTARHAKANPNALKIMKHVSGRVHDFIDKHKPSALRMDGTSDQKDNIYGKFGKGLAKRYGGKAKGASVLFKEEIEAAILEAIKTRQDAIKDLYLNARPAATFPGQITTDTKVSRGPKATQSFKTSRFYTDGGQISRIYHAVRNKLAGQPSIGRSVKSIPLDQVRTSQPTVDRSVVADKIRSTKGGPRKPGTRDHLRFPIAVKDHKSGMYDITDGNHKVQARSWRGFKNVRAHVVEDSDDH